MKTMKILVADESAISRNSLVAKLTEAAAKRGRKLEIIARVSDGDTLISEYTKFSATMKIDLVFTEIRLPGIDGLSALVRLRALQSLQRIVMVSSEDAATMEFHNRARRAEANVGIDFEKKLDLLRKIANRIAQGQPEPGKIQSLLEGCEKLAADPIAVARHFGAAGYLRKPYDEERALVLLKMLEDAAEFALVA